jgi:hypothetical protein
MPTNITQDFLYETGSLESFGKVLDTIVRVMYKEPLPSQYAQLFLTKRKDNCVDDGKKLIKHANMSGIWSKPKFLHICSIGDYRKDIKEGDACFDSHDELVQAVLSQLRDADRSKFYEQCGDGFNEWFNHDDGSIGSGFRLKHRPRGGWNMLDVSLCHIYRGK